jgi:serine/threonine protein phosphatase PrpC
MGTGCTACVVLITPTKIYTANAGDSRAVLSRKGHAIPLSYDHKPENEIERKRISAAGGEIINGRVNGGLNLSRSLGDFNYKRMKNRPWDEQLISCKPDVSEINRQPGDDEFIILGCDGIWEKYVNDSQPMVTKIENLKKTGHDCVSILKTLLDELVARETSEEVGCDNMTCVLIEFM